MEQREKVNAIIDALFENAIRFLRITIKNLTIEDFNSIDSISVTCVMIQTTVELSLKYALAYNHGNISLKNILDRKKHGEQTIDEIYNDFINNALRIREFESLKNQLVGSFRIDFLREEIKKMDDFQHIRNKLLHFTYNFNDEEKKDIKKTYLYIVFRVIFPLLYEKYSEEAMDYLTPKEFLQVYISKKEFEKIIRMNEYRQIMSEVAESIEKARKITLGTCIDCRRRGWIIESGKCLICGRGNEGEKYLTCPSCNTPKAICYQTLNMDCNNNTTGGRCLVCNKIFSIIKCKKCGKYNIYEGVKIRNETRVHKLKPICDGDCLMIPKIERLPADYPYIMAELTFLREKDKTIKIINPYKNVLRIFSKGFESNYEKSSSIREAITKSLDYLITQEYIELNISKDAAIDQLVEGIKDVIDKKYITGSFKERDSLYKEVAEIVHGKEIEEQFNKLLPKFVHMVREEHDKLLRNFSTNSSDLLEKAEEKARNRLTDEEVNVLYICRDYLDIDTKILLGLYSDNKLYKPNELL